MDYTFEEAMMMGATIKDLMKEFGITEEEMTEED